jgi:hypothetical protein
LNTTAGLRHHRHSATPQRLLLGTASKPPRRPPLHRMSNRQGRLDASCVEWRASTEF